MHAVFAFQTTSTKSLLPTDWCHATNTIVTTPTAKCSRAAITSAKNGRSTSAKTRPSLQTLTIRQLRPLGESLQLDNRIRRKPPTNPLLPKWMEILVKKEIMGMVHLLGSTTKIM